MEGLVVALVVAKETDSFEREHTYCCCSLAFAAGRGGLEGTEETVTSEGCGSKAG